MPFMRGRREQMQNAPGAEQRQNEAGREQVPNQFGMRQMPGGIEREQMPDRPGREEISNRDGTKQIQNQETKEQNSNESGMQQIPNGFGAQGRFGGFIGGFGRMGARGGADLKYIDDSPSSYWAIRNNAVFRTTTDADFKKVIEMIKKLNEGTDLEKYQAPLCLCTLQRVSIPPEGTFGRLRYLLGGDRPSQTAYLTLSMCRLHGSMLEFQHVQGGISPSAPVPPKGYLLSLPPILRSTCQNPISGYSKAPWGLPSCRG